MKKNIFKKRNLLIIFVIILFITLSYYTYLNMYSDNYKNEIEFIDLWESETNTISIASGSLQWFE